MLNSVRLCACGGKDKMYLISSSAAEHGDETQDRSPKPVLSTQWLKTALGR